ncbi:1-deoxy-D-xylulose-5-phosphate synthase [Desulfohalobiaceae bacterium Ax17]|jgi:1-deoxy-D-xylulose-5-phosphate synthase|uniref:1-deoxy-D-xylulose-5-phosphate synthase n=1 Tax=Desulfovulcanus ferrireducens TaxID=2831190 RepID=UPI00207B9D60|nr:1-deoxy-D-xylulose-5-phosphate synthase [Desulfovulcanus ferrireducens]MBT8762507.1 1-deoxy-D-xylulose-5-phosphate synthase [Desulfovulcanus ferrireducens]
MTKKILARIDRPQDISSLSLDDLTELAKEIRELIIEVVAKNGGHLAPSLGVVELTLALLKVFDPGHDKFIWDVGHQAYAYKILTGRKDNFHTLRRLGGISGFPKPSESVYDHFGVGHSSTSISAGLGMAVARDILGQSQKVLAIIGDGSMTGGLAYEGLNQAGDLDRDLIVILNDNEMSIAKNVGALSSFLSRKLTSRWVLRLKKEMEAWMRQIPKIGDELVHYARRSEESLKIFFTPGMLFEAFKFNYLGPIDGHNLKRLIEFFDHIKTLEGPLLVHVLTKKGKGYKPAENNPTYFHGVGCFEPETGAAKKFGTCFLPSYTDVFGQTLCSLAEKDDRIVAITAAMPEGTGLSSFAQKFPDRFFDVGICEQHAVTFAAGLATQGFKPVVAIYSTFLQRSYDQIVHDVCLQNLPVTFCLDRGGLVGEDGPTHHGAFDLSYLRHVPNMTLMAPKDEAELQDLLYTAINYPGPSAVRYPRGVGVGVELKDNFQNIPLGQGELLRDGQDGLIVAIGSRVYPALEAAQELEEENDLQIAVYNARFVKPLPEDDLRQLASKFNKLLLVEENVLAGGFGSAVLEFLADNGLLTNLMIKRIGLPDKFVEHGPQKVLRQMLGLGKDGIKKSVLKLVQGE